MKMKLLPSEVDKQDFDILLWLALSPDEETTKDEIEAANAPIMGML
ncbi:hypothetical protein L323_08660 [Ruminiclostridium papyrosolvens C7]|uniref:Uncharacterized protein n=1 Tax=Ruminiclostridium papyrosolvens C7 TaxID=1330534 RepID=U4R282_9FIRM|nr:hypothetical protein L323_08660 [Ruminiclostridium papyrosolvens C7]